MNKVVKKKSLFVIGPQHYCHSTATLIEGLNKLDKIKVFSGGLPSLGKRK